MRKADEIAGFIFTCFVSLFIGVGAYLLFCWGGMGAQATHGLLSKGLPIFGLVMLWQIYRIWRMPKDD